jgi:hypothetical protein
MKREPGGPHNAIGAAVFAAVRYVFASARGRYAKLSDQISADRPYLCLIDNVPASNHDVQVLLAAKERRPK